MTHTNTRASDRPTSRDASHLKIFVTSIVFELQKWVLRQNGVKFCKKCNDNDKSAYSEKTTALANSECRYGNTFDLLKIGCPLSIAK